MSEFHQYVKAIYAEYGQPGVEDPYKYVKKCEIFWDEVQKFQRLSTPE